MKKIKYVRIDKKADKDNWYTKGAVYPVTDGSDIHYDFGESVLNPKVIFKSDCTEIDISPGTVIDGIRWYSILDKDLPEVQALVGGRVAFRNQPYSSWGMFSEILVSINDAFHVVDRGFQFIGIPEKTSPKIPDEKTKKGTPVRVRDWDDCEWIEEKIYFHSCDGTPEKPFLVKDADGDICNRKYCEIVEDEK